MRSLARAHRLPQPTFNDTLDVADHPGLEADCCSPAYDCAKDAALTVAGYTVVRFTWRQLRDDPGTVADRIGAILALHYVPASASWNSASSDSSIE